MLRINSLFIFCLLIGTFFLTSCASTRVPGRSSALETSPERETHHYADYSSRLPSHMNTGEKVIVVDPNKHVWGAYAANGTLLRAGLATAGADWCADLGRRCHTSPGRYRINSLGNANCKSSIFPIPRGGAPMPYCMFFNGGQGLHGSYQLAEANLSHGCVRLSVSDAAWLRFNFATVGTRVIVRPY